MSDRELLEMAAKAAGINAKRLPHAWPDRFDDDQWNPLIDDGDALRLAVTLGHKVVTPKYKGFGSSCNDVTVFETDGCPYAQTRRAIVMAAAEIGKAMP